MKIAFLIGVSKYDDDSLSNLPACDQDVFMMKQLLNATGEYKNIKVICNENDTNCDSIKSELRNLIKEIKGENIKEFFFYFSGHGSQDNKDLFFCCSDYNNKFSKTTSLSNSEIDELIREIDPELAVKIIDSCQSGYQYIKDINSIDIIQKNMKDKCINDCIFMFSSKKNQYSFADDNISVFTKAFLDAVFTQKNKEIYYRDIENYIIDEFKDFKQTPYFSNQRTGLEIFTSNNNNNIQKLKPNYHNLIHQKNNQKSLPSSILEVINEMEKDYILPEKIDEYLKTIEPSKLSIQITDETIKDLYKVKDINSISMKEADPKIIANKIKNTKWEDDCFVDIIYEKYNIRKLRDNASYLHSLNKITNPFFYTDKVSENDDRFYKTVTKYRPSNIKINHDMPFECLCLNVESPKVCLVPWNFYLSIIPARKYCVLVIGYAKFKRGFWDEFTFDTSEIKWFFEELLWRHWEQDDPIERLTTKLQQVLRQDILQLTGLTLEVEYETSETEIINLGENSENKENS